MPRDEDAKLAGIEPKDRGAEERAIIDVALGVRAFHLRCCKWNQGISPDNPGVGPDNIVMQIRENLEHEVLKRDTESCGFRLVVAMIVKEIGGSHLVPRPLVLS